MIVMALMINEIEILAVQILVSLFVGRACASTLESCDLRLGIPGHVSPRLEARHVVRKKLLLTICPRC